MHRHRGLNLPLRYKSLMFFFVKFLSKANFRLLVLPNDIVSLKWIAKGHWYVLRFCFCFTFWLCWTKLWLAHVIYENGAHNFKKCKQRLISLILFLSVSGHLKGPHCKQKNSKRLVFTFKKTPVTTGIWYHMVHDPNHWIPL